MTSNTRIITLPALRCAGTAIVGIILSSRTHLAPEYWMAGSLALWTAVLIGVLWTRTRALAGLLAPLLWLLVLGLSSEVEDRLVNTDLFRCVESRDKVTYRAVVLDRPERKADRMRVPVRILSSDPVGARGEALVFARSAPVGMGDTVFICGFHRIPRPATVDGGFDYRAHLRHRGWAATILAMGPEAVWRERAAHPGVWNHLVDEVRRGVESGLRRLFDSAHEGLMRSLVIGDRSMVDEDTEEHFRRTGVIHILSVSGSHVTMILAMLWLITGRIALRYRVLLVLPLLALYAAVTGGEAPVVRSVLMSAALVSAPLLQRPTRALNLLGAAALLLLAFQPHDLFHLGFQLSFASVGALLVLTSPSRRFLLRLLPSRWRTARIPKFLAEAFAVTLSAQIGTLPFMMASFGRTSPMAFLANPLVIPLVFVAMCGGLAAVLLLPLWAGGARALAASASMALDSTRTVTDVLSRPVWAEWTLPSIPDDLLLGGSLVILLVLLPDGRRGGRIALLALTVLVLQAWWPRSPENQPRLDVVDVGQGDAILLRTASGRTLLVDAGSMRDGGRILPDWLRHEGIRAIDLLVVTHSDEDHLGGVPTLLESVRVGSVITSGRWEKEGLPARVSALLREKGVPVQHVVAGCRLPFDETLRIQILAPEPRDSTTESGNATSLVLRIQYGATVLLLMGDAEQDQEEAMLRRWGPLLRATLLKCGHHGSRHGSSDVFLDSVRPRQALLSCGRLNRFRHPHPTVLARLLSRRSAVFRTDLHGRLCVLLSPDSCTIDSFLTP